MHGPSLTRGAREFTSEPKYDRTHRHRNHNQIMKSIRITLTLLAIALVSQGTTRAQDPLPSWKQSGREGFMNAVDVGGWNANWAWSLPLIVLNVVIHVIGLGLINESIIRVLSNAKDYRPFMPTFVLVMGVAALLAIDAAAH